MKETSLRERERAAPAEARRARGELTVTLNGEPRTLPAGSTVAELLHALALDPRLVVVEHNRAILRDRDAYARVALSTGDVIEIVHFVGGG